MQSSNHQIVYRLVLPEIFVLLAFVIFFFHGTILCYINRSPTKQIKEIFGDISWYPPPQNLMEGLFSSQKT